MGKTLFGIDLDESPVGGLIEGLLSEEDLEKLADGGRVPGDGDDEADDVGTDLVDDAVESGDASEATESSDGGSIPVGTAGRDSASEWDTPNPDGVATGPVPSPGAEDDDGGWKEKLRPIVLKGTVALAGLAVVGFLAYRYLGKAKSVASDKLGSDDESEPPEPRPSDVSGDVPEARRRAKASGRDREEYGDRPVDQTVGDVERSESREDQSGSASVGRPRADSDVGALVGLAALAIVAAAVRKLSEQPEYDPLVEGPTDAEDE